MTNAQAADFDHPPPQQVNMKSTRGTKLCVLHCKRPLLSYNLISVVKTILITPWN